MPDIELLMGTPSAGGARRVRAPLDAAPDGRTSAGQDKPTDPDAGPGCPFLPASPTLSDEDGLIVARGHVAFVVLNLYPYNSGHLLGLARIGTSPTYTDLTDDEVGEVASLTRTAIDVFLRTVSGAARIQPGA